VYILYLECSYSVHISNGLFIICVNTHLASMPVLCFLCLMHRTLFSLLYHTVAGALELTWRTLLYAFQAGKCISRDCGKCHSSLSVTYASASFQSASGLQASKSQGAKRQGSSLSPGGETQRRAAQRDALTKALEKLQVGQPLPGTGTCKHYRHSHRCACVFAFSLLPGRHETALPSRWETLMDSHSCKCNGNGAARPTWLLMPVFARTAVSMLCRYSSNTVCVCVCEDYKRSRTQHKSRVQQ
jgi:hypothetical protein